MQPRLGRATASRFRDWLAIALAVFALLAVARLAPADTGTGDPAAVTSDLDRRLTTLGLARGAPVLLRLFKQESELELWMRAGDRFRLFATYKICRWRGVLGPKLTEGDRQSPEGFYSFGQDQLLWQGHWFRAFNINYPNTLDRALGRSGSGILIHGACSSIGCYAMTDPVIDEMFDLIVAAFAAGQPRVQVHIFPFHMTLANLARHENSLWASFWRDLKPASDLFVSTQMPPRLGVCDGRYVVRPGQTGAAADPRIRDWCGSMPWTGSADRVQALLDSRRALATPDAAILAAKPPSDRIVLYARLLREGKIPKPQPLPSQPGSFGPSPVMAADNAGPLADLAERERAALLGVRGASTVVQAAAAEPPRSGPTGGGPSCNTGLASCRHFLAASHPSRVALLRAGKPKVVKR